MKKAIIFSLSLFTCISSYSQSQNWWKSDGNNTANSSSAVGTSNFQPLRFKANGNEYLTISPTGAYTFTSLNSVTKGILGVDQSGLLYRTDFTGNSFDVLSGTGDFVNIGSLSGWSQDGNILFTNYNVGIGTNITPEKLTINGNILANGSISGTSINVVDIVTSGKEFKISTSLCMKGIDVNDPNSRNELCGMNGDLFIQSEHNNNYNTVFGLSNGSKTGFGVVPTENFHVGVKARFDDYVYMNKIIPNDSIFTIGENTIHVNTYGNNIWGSQTPSGSVKGIGFGSPSAYGYGVRSIAIGNRVRADGESSIIIGQSNTTTSPQFRNTIDNSLMIGFNSNLPTLTVLPANGTGTTGQVGIGTTCVPNGYSLAVKGKVIMEEGTVRLADANGCWPDFVFEESYSKMNWENKLDYINTNKHLPYMPSAKEIDKSGLDVGTGMAAITQNVEENTLDIIQLYKEMQTMKMELEKLKEENLKLKNQLEDKH